MANDIDMWNDIETLEKEGEQKKADDLLNCFRANFDWGDKDRAEDFKEAFEKKYGYWGNYY